MSLILKRQTIVVVSTKHLSFTKQNVRDTPLVDFSSILTHLIRFPIKSFGIQNYYIVDGDPSRN